MIDTRIGRAPIRAISYGGGTLGNQQLPTGYTAAHLVFPQEEARNKKKAGGFVAGSVSTVQVKVTMVQPTMKGTRVVFLPVHEVTLFPTRVSSVKPDHLPQDLWDTISVPANVEMDTLRRVSIERLRPMWDRWSHGYVINERDATMYATIPGNGHKKLSGDSCILEFFVKKTRRSAAVVEYNFSLIPELVLHFSNAFYERVVEYREAKESQLQVRSSHIQLYYFLKLHSPMQRQRITSRTQ